MVNGPRYRTQCVVCYTMHPRVCVRGGWIRSQQVNNDVILIIYLFSSQQVTFILGTRVYLVAELYIRSTVW